MSEAKTEYESPWKKDVFGLPSWNGRSFATTEQMAELVQMEGNTFEQWRTKRKGPPKGVVWFKVGGSVRYDPGRFFEWLDKQQEEDRLDLVGRKGYR